MDNNLLIAFIITTVVMVGILFWLLTVYIRLKQELFKLGHTLEQNNRDIAGLCSAAVSVDRRLSENSGEIKRVAEKVTGFERHQQQQQNSPPYQNAIEKIRNGAKAEELMELCGLSREEANVLISMHGFDNG